MELVHDPAGDYVLVSAADDIDRRHGQSNEILSLRRNVNAIISKECLYANTVTAPNPGVTGEYEILVRVKCKERSYTDVYWSYEVHVSPLEVLFFETPQLAQKFIDDNWAIFEELKDVLHVIDNI